MKKISRGVVFWVFVCFRLGCGSGTEQSQIVERVVRLGNSEYSYFVYIPVRHSLKRKWPTVLFLHGAGERGQKGKQLSVGLGPALQKIPSRYRKFIAVFPQAPANTRWIGEPAEAAMLALEQTITELNGDERRIYLTGISMGGYGTWHLAIQHPHRFAAITPICGGIVSVPRVKAVRQLPATIGSLDPYKVAAKKLPRIPIWIFHGEKDPVIPATESRRMFTELKSIGADVRYTEYASVDHNSWDRAYAEEQLWRWMLEQHR